MSGSPHGVAVYVQDCDILVDEFKLQWHYGVHFRTNALGKGMNSFIPFSIRLNSTTTDVLQGWLWHYITHEDWYAIK